MEYNVLIAEDDESIVELLTLYLNSNGFNVISANDGEAAMELLASENRYCFGRYYDVKDEWI